MINKYKNVCRIFLFSMFYALATFAFGQSVDLNTWTAEGPGTWTVQAPPNNDSVIQSDNGNPTVFFTPVLSQGTALSGKITVRAPSGDNDFMGFVLGYNTGDLTNPSADYILIDWKKDPQMSGGCMGPMGFAISHVSGALIASPDAWCHQNNVTEIARGTTLGATGWAEGTTYTFDMTFTPNLIEVRVNGSLEISITPADVAAAGVIGFTSFANGGFGFYNYSQPHVTYAGVALRKLPPTHIPTLSFIPLLFTMIMLGGVALRRFQKK